MRLRSSSLPKVLCEFPVQLLVKVTKALSAYPTIVQRNVPLLQGVCRARLPELGPTSFAVVVTPGRFRRSVLLEPDDRPASPFRVVDPPICHIRQQAYHAQLL